MVTSAMAARFDRQALASCRLEAFIEDDNVSRRQKKQTIEPRRGAVGGEVGIRLQLTVVAVTVVITVIPLAAPGAGSLDLTSQTLRGVLFQQPLTLLPKKK